MSESRDGEDKIAPEDVPGRVDGNRWVPLVFGVLGLVLALERALSLAFQPWDLDASSPTVVGTATGCSWRTGAPVEIEVDRTTHVCYGASERCSYGRASVAYDPEQPTRCRVAAAVDRPSDYEISSILFALAFAAIGLQGVVQWSRRVHAEDAARLHRLQRLERIAGWASKLFALALFGFAAFVFLTRDGG